MTGLLGRLAAQAAGAQPAVRRHPRSRFEPDRLTGGASDIVELYRDVNAPALVKRTPSVRATPPTSTLVAEPAQTLPSVGDRRTTDVPEQRRSGDQTAVIPPRRSPPTERRADDAAPSRIPAPPIDRGRAPARAEPAAGPAPFRVAAAGAAVLRTEGVAAPRPPTRRLDHGRPRPDQGLLTAPAVRLAPPPSTHRPASDERRHAPPVEEPAPPPEIHVSIGRIEVRATAHPPAAVARPASPPASPGMALGDYLRERSEGRRR